MRLPPSPQQEEMHKGEERGAAGEAALELLPSPGCATGSVLSWATGRAGVGATPHGEDGARQSCLHCLPVRGNLHGGHSLSRAWGRQKEGELPHRGSGLSWLHGHRGKGEYCRAVAWPCASVTREGALSPTSIVSWSCRNPRRGAKPQLTASGLSLQPCRCIIRCPGSSERRQETCSLELSGNWGDYNAEGIL